MVTAVRSGMERWLAARAGTTGFFYVVAVCVGIFCGASAAALKRCITLVKDMVFDSFSIRQGNWAVLLLPVTGIVIAVLFTRYVVRSPMDHASERVASDLAGVGEPPRQGEPDPQGNPRVRKAVSLSPRLVLGPLVCCSFTLGLGGSAGAESPIAYTGAALGSNIGRVLGVSTARLAALLGCGAAAGIAGIYMAPIGGAMYALEVLRMRQSLETVLALVFSSLAAALTCYILLGCHTDVSFVPEMRFDTGLIPYVLGCGVFCGVYSVYYSRLLEVLRRQFGRIGNVWCKALAGGVVLAVLLFLFPSLYGEGYGTIGALMEGDATTIISYGPLYPLGSDFTLLMLLFVGLLLVKPVATAATNDSGGVAGDFTPTFFCGGVAGFLFAVLLNHVFGLQLPIALFAFFGMAAVMAGAVRAPLMAIFIAAEMTGMYGFILPLTLAALASYLTTRVFRSGSVIPGAAAPAPR